MDHLSTMYYDSDDEADQLVRSEPNNVSSDVDYGDREVIIFDAFSPVTESLTDTTSKSTSSTSLSSTRHTQERSKVSYKIYY